MEIPVKSPIDPDWILTTPETMQFKPILLFMPVKCFCMSSVVAQYWVSFSGIYLDTEVFAECRCTNEINHFLAH